MSSPQELSPDVDYQRLADEVAHFNTAVIQATVEGSALKVLHEAAEFSEKPTIYEAADVLITLLGAIQLRGHTADDLVEAALAKMYTNTYEREWTRQSDGTWQHRVKDD